MTEDWIIASSEGPNGPNQSESVIFFRRENESWVRHSKITSNIPDVGFGFGVAIEGNTAVVGSIIDFDPADRPTGVAYIYEFNEATDAWELTQSLSPTELDIDDFFGNHIYIQGDVLAISARQDRDNGFNSGAVYVFEKNQDVWTLEDKIVPDDSSSEDVIGYRVNGDGDRIILSGFGADNQTGSTYIYQRQSTEWILETRLIASDLEEGDWFGSSVAIDGNRAIVGARQRNQLAGEVFVFENNSDNGIWTQTMEFDPPEGVVEGRFGAGLDYQNGRLVIGAPWTNNLQGAAFAFEFETVSVREQNIESLFLYPNPSQDFIHLNLKDNQIKTVELFDMLGAKVATYNYTGDPLDIRQLSAGTYVVKSNKDNTTIEIGKFVKL